jgi:hypothetical protein
MILAVVPPAEHVHWMFASGVLLTGLCLLAQAFVGDEVWNRRTWRRYLMPSLFFLLGLFMWPVMTFFTNSTIHMLAHGSWAQVMMLAGAAHFGLAAGKLHSPYWRLTMPLAFVVSGAAFLVHEQNGWLYARSSFVHHMCGWTLVLGAIFPLLLVFRPRSWALGVGYAASVIVIAVVLFSARDVAPVFGHLSPEAGIEHR